MSITTIGYGDIVPKTRNEKIFVMVLAVFAVDIFGYILNKQG